MADFPESVAESIFASFTTREQNSKLINYEIIEESDRLRMVLSNLSPIETGEQGFDHSISAEAGSQLEDETCKPPERVPSSEDETDLTLEIARSTDDDAGEQSPPELSAGETTDAPPSAFASEQEADAGDERSEGSASLPESGTDAAAVRDDQAGVPNGSTDGQASAQGAGEGSDAAGGAAGFDGGDAVAGDAAAASVVGSFASCPCPMCSHDFSGSGVAAPGDDLAVGPAGSLGTLATYLNERNSGSGANDFWDEFWGGGSDYPTPFWNLTGAGTNAQSGIITYNVTGNNFDGNGIGSASRIDLIRHALNVYEDILGINFVETTAVNADLNFGDWDPGRAYANFNHSADGSIINSWINIASNWSGGSAIGDYYFHTALHEIGHVLGLGHQGLYNAGAGSPTYDDATWANDTIQFTMMSYWAQGNYTPPGELTPSGAFLGSVNVIGPQVVDWLALDRIYNPQGFGIANGATTGNTTWGFNSSWVDWTPTNAGPVSGLSNTAYASLDTLLDTNTVCIVDGGGVDTLDLSGFANNTKIDIGISSASSVKPAFSNVAGLIGNLSIAAGTVIENVVGGAGSELIYGNSVANNLNGGAGNDTILGDAGNDTLLGGIGNDSLLGGTNVDTLYGGAGNDTLDGGLFNDTSYGEDGNDIFLIRGSDLADNVYGGTGIDTLDVSGYTNASLGFNIDLAAGTYDFQPTAFGPYVVNSVENVIGSLRDDRINGDSANNVLSGGGGNDSILGGIGNDTVNGDDGNDTLQGGFGTDTVNGGFGNDTIVVLEGEFGDQVDGGSGIDVLDLSAVTSRGANVNLDTGLWDFSPTFGGPNSISNIETVLGTQANDTLTGTYNTQTLSGNGGDDLFVILDGRFGDDISGGTGTDTLDLSPTIFAPAIVDLTAGTYTISSAFWPTWTINTVENVIGTVLGDTLTGNSSTNVITGGGGNDVINGGGFGADTLLGGAGNDRVFWGPPSPSVATPRFADGGAGRDVIDGGGTSFGAVTFDLGAGTYNNGGSFTETWINFENYYNATGTGSETVIGSSANNVIETGSGANTLDGGVGADTLIGGAGNDNYVVDSALDRVIEAIAAGIDRVLSSILYRLGSNLENLTLTFADDIAGYGNAGNNEILGNSGDNRLDGRGGIDTLNGGAGDDLLIDRDGGDRLIGGDGGDRYLIFDASTVVEETGVGGIDIVQSTVTHTLASGVERLSLKGSAPINGTGNALDNVMNAGNSNNILSGLDGNDRLSAAGGDDTVDGGAGSDTVFGGSGDDSIVGGDGDDFLYGELGSDILQGGAGNDRLFGGGQNDILTGGSGVDQYVFEGRWSFDTVTDFEDGLDRLNLRDLRDENGGAAINFAQLLLVQSGTTARIRLDLDQDGVADLIDLDEDGALDNVSIDLLNTDVATLSAADFIF
jgi:serralysin